MVLLLSSSCNRRPSNVLSPKKMELLLTDIHLLSGTLQSSGSLYQEEERQPYYVAVLDNYKITEEDFDSCISWYTRHPKKFERIYIKVDKRFEQIIDDVDNFKYHPHDTLYQRDIWPDNRRFLVRKSDSIRNKVHFNIDASNYLPYDRFELSFLHRIAPSDSSSNQHSVMYISYENGDTDSIFVATKNDSILRRITLKFSARKMQDLKEISGRLLGFDEAKGSPFATVDSIKLYRKNNPQQITKIRQHLDELNEAMKQMEEISLSAPDVNRSSSWDPDAEEGESLDKPKPRRAVSKEEAPAEKILNKKEKEH